MARYCWHIWPQVQSQGPNVVSATTAHTTNLRSVDYSDSLISESLDTQNRFWSVLNTPSINRKSQFRFCSELTLSCCPGFSPTCRMKIPTIEFKGQQWRWIGWDCLGIFDYSGFLISTPYGFQTLPCPYHRIHSQLRQHSRRISRPSHTTMWACIFNDRRPIIPNIFSKCPVPSASIHPW